MMGSEGRGEQTLVTDQDNAIVYEDVAPDQNEGAKAYFLELGGKVCTWFDQAGYAFCKGDVMARTAKWCVPLARWKEHFDGWINEAEPQNLIKFNIFFDFRCVYGESELVEQLRAHIDRSMAETPSFFLHFSQNTLLYKPPLSLFGGIQVESGGDKPSTFSIKDAMIPIVGFARIYALKHGVTEANTLERLERLFERDVLKKGTYEELSLAYDYLMQVRFQHQAAALAAGGPPDNLINPKELAEIEQVMVRKIFGQLGNFLKKISYDFLGVA